ncbi:MAG: hypothetical protein WC461_03395 [Candidatus Paceibacterota bacterium]
MSITGKPKDFQILFLDMNAFFASVEQQIQPPLRGKPVAVAPYVGNSGCIITSSYEAKKFAVMTGDRVVDGRKKCHNLVVVESKPEIYLNYHKRILKALGNHSPFVEPCSIDEFAIRLTGSDCQKNRSAMIAREIKKTIARDVGDFLKCSIGVGPNIFLAKVAGGMKKPDGFNLVELKKLKKFYRQLELLDLPGINFRLAKRLLAIGIRTPFELFELPLIKLKYHFGHSGTVWFYRLHGFEIESSNHPPKSIGHSCVLSPELRNRESLRSVAGKLIQKIGKRLREQMMVAGGIFIYIKFYNNQQLKITRKTEAVNSDYDLNKIIFEILELCPIREKPLKIAISVFNLGQANGHQLSIFENVNKENSLFSAIDKINDRFGVQTVYLGSSACALKAAPDRISFGVPRFEIRH